MSDTLDTTTTVVPLDDPIATDRAAAGGKAAVLARLRQDGLPIPDGFVIPVDVTRAITGQERRDAVPLGNSLRIAVASALADLGGGPVAVRSSAAAEDAHDASWAGQFDTVLGVEGPDAVTDAIATVLASVDAARVASYEAAHPGADAGIAVLVQRMVPATAAGVAFSANPVTGARDQTLVSAVRGLGDRLVAGEADPDEFVVRGDDVEVVARPEAAVAVDRVLEVARLAERLEELLGTPQDIEWAAGPDGVQLLQSRPITALPTPPTVDLPAGSWVKDTTHHPEPMHPLASVYLEALEHGIAVGMCEHWGLMVERLEQRMIGGELYGRVVPLGGKDGPPPPWWVLGLLARIVPPIRARVKTAEAAVASGQLETLPTRWEEELRPAFQARIQDLRAVALDGLDDPALLEHLDDTVQLLHDGQVLHFRLFIPYAVALHELVTTAQDVLGWQTARTMELLQGLSTASSAPVTEMDELARLVASHSAAHAAVLDAGDDLLERLDEVDEQVAIALRAHLDRWGVHTINYDPGSPTVAERPALFAGLLREALARTEGTAGDDVRAARQEARAAAQARLDELAVTANDRARFEDALDRAARAYPLREDNLFWTDSVPNGVLRRAALAIGQRLAHRGLLTEAEDVAWLEVGELRDALRGRIDRSALHCRIQRRRGERRWTLANPGPPVLGEEPSPPPDVRGLPTAARRTNGALLWIMGLEGLTPGNDKVTGDADLIGSPGAAGRYTGTVRVIRRQQDFDRLRPGDVLVAPITAPAWSVLFARAGAVVTDTGGVLSHAAIVAREHGLPAVLGTGDATTRLRDGMTVTIDGRAGTITIEEATP